MGRILEIRWHGRGGQGVVLASRILAKACFLEGKWAQAFPFFGAERRGAPVTAFNRISDRPIRRRSQIYSPDILVFVDPMFLRMPGALSGLKEGGSLIANTHLPPEEVKARAALIATVPATDIAVKLKLSVAGLSVPNTVMLGALSRATGIVRLSSLKEAIKGLVREDMLELNRKAMELGYEKVRIYSPS